MPLIHKTLWLVKEAGGGGYYGHYKMTPPPPQLQNTRCYLARRVYSYHSISMPLIHKTLWLVKEAVVGGGGVKILWPL